MLSPKLTVLLTSMVPVLEMKAGIPVGVKMGLTVPEATLLGIIGTCVQIPLNLLLINLLIRMADRYPLARRLLDWSRRRSEQHRGSINRWGMLGVAVLVGVPIPGTGLWTGTVAGTLIGLNRWWLVAGLIVGTVMAGVLVGLTTAGVVHLL